MLLTLTCSAPNAPEVGYLLGKHPASVFRREFSAGTVWAFYPEVNDDRVTVALVVDVDPIGLVRGPAALTQLDQYVNNRPYVASSLVSVALRTAFASALAGHSKEHPELLDRRYAWQVRLPAVSCDGGAELIERVFAPLGYAVTTTRLPLDPQFPAWGESNLYGVTLAGEQTVRGVLGHLYVLLPVLDNSKHYFVDAAETEKLLAHGGDWLAAHPERELIARRYLRYKRPLVASALARLAESDPALAEEAGEDQSAEGAEPQETDEPVQGLHEQRLAAVLAAVREAGAHSLVDLGCGEGRLLALALNERSLTRIFGMDVSSVALARARRRLHYDTLPPAQRARLELAQGSLLYRDTRLEGFDAAALVEVIEHLDPPRLEALERVVFAHARPRRVVVTTPNREYNVHWATVGETRLRHGDHRFEWTRAECAAWAERVAAAHGYRATRQDLGPTDPDLGAPSQLVIFDRL
ncbi:MAG TPA: 3' terminal RNA ribose 2'-O-methyltransferase Hen1 [Ktedonobacterales bacterium]|nr:3' terminal RNA ribose 2'-O-methyltransferase Hen1 [Ktedonobacterales bacterium]